MTLAHFFMPISIPKPILNDSGRKSKNFEKFRYKIVLEAILFSALGDACAGSTRPNTAKNMHFFGQKFEFFKIFSSYV